jgi:[protein-PII] uridylyltransferase
MFTTKTSVQFGENTPDGRTVLDLITADRPGLLSEVGQAFIEQGIDIEAAKIMTIGERAEDVFYISDEAGAPLTEDAREQLCDKLVARLDDECKT